MKYYLICPVDCEITDKARHNLINPLIARMVFDCFETNKDESLYAVSFQDRSTFDRPPDRSHGNFGIHYMRNTEEVYQWISKSLNPYEKGFAHVRSQINCRALQTGWDGQALLCLRQEDPPPISPDQALITVIDRSEMLIRSDWLDGFSLDVD